MIRVVQILLIVSAVVWLAFGVFYLAGPNASASNIIIAVLMFINAASFGALAWLVTKKNRWIFYFAILFLIGHIILTLTDEFGVFDLIVLAIDLATLGILLFKRRLFTEKM